MFSFDTNENGSIRSHGPAVIASGPVCFSSHLVRIFGNWVRKLDFGLHLRENNQLLGLVLIFRFLSPGKMILHDAQLIEKLFFGRHSIACLTCGTMKSYESARRLDNYDTQENICTRYYT